jgi:septum formation protein
VLPGTRQELLEKPTSKEDNLRMLLDLNGGVCEVVTGVTVGEYTIHAPLLPRIYLGKIFDIAVYPVLSAPGYTIK